ncbi:mitochondrial ribosomal large subunit component [Tulasnella sp. 419]|nr:mitochondrial ribosomal large subunit component [Tulasnella sp. 419]
MSLFSSLKRCTSLPTSLFNPITAQARFKQNLAPKFVKWSKAHKGRVPIPTGGSIKGTTLAFGDFGIRIKGNGIRMTAKQLQAAEATMKRKLKVVKGAKIWMRVFPDIPVCVKGNETRMGKGKGSFEYWACRVPTGRVVFEVAGEPGGAELREELAREALRLASDKLPVPMEFITKSTPPKLGNLDIVNTVDAKTRQATVRNPEAPRFVVGGVRKLRVLGVRDPPPPSPSKSEQPHS